MVSDKKKNPIIITMTKENRENKHLYYNGHDFKQGVNYM